MKKLVTAGISKITVVFFVLLLVCLLSVGTYANVGNQYWPSWRGPDMTGAAQSGNPPVTWSETENIKWKVEVPGEGLSTPVIWEDKIFFLTAVSASTGGSNAASGGGRGGLSSPPEGEYDFDFVCMDRNTGDIIWQETAISALPHEGSHPTGSYASYSAVTDGEYVWASFGSRGVYCYDMNGERIWGKDLGQMTIRMAFGEGSSAALAGDALIVVMDHQGDSAIYALDKKTGEQLWKKDRDEPSSWATPLTVEVDGNLQVITSATNLIRSYNPENGDVIWQCSGQTQNVIPSPVNGLGMVFCISGYQGNKLQAIRLNSDTKGDISGTEAVVWEISDRITPYVPSPLLYGDKIYFLSNNDAILSCYQAQNGKPNYVAQELDGARGFYASPVGAADRIYLASQNGAILVIKHSDTYEVLATNTLEDQFNASPVVVGDELFLKGSEYLYCIAEE